MCWPFLVVDVQTAWLRVDEQIAKSGVAGYGVVPQRRGVVR
ncbi:hypothetical protein J155_00354 [Xanthomonas citri pv. citri]|nr:hypothetical protein J151_00355 [Xanthomonas citri subsp. citri A306]AJY80362.1 hypothetical protein J159_00353 [Xanthomonas citri pv. citri]AJY84784.1 hypothetical protein J158_00353 [Xanthomonas citri subsp. citri UI6]UDI79592.1 hypothetical protein XCM_1380 [Xanthomonas citri pv. mangiferaeindicae]UIE43066.1 hypothetical protein FICKIIDM_02176 [Xanthomonas citri pv. punicae]CEJ44259.1 hypothetical protein XAB3213_250016 [Xanthomonas citri pv. bilvae]